MGIMKSLIPTAAWNTRNFKDLQAGGGAAEGAPFPAKTGQLADAILSIRDILGIMPAGAGNSPCCQIPALPLPGIA